MYRYSIRRRLLLSILTSICLYLSIYGASNDVKFFACLLGTFNSLLLLDNILGAINEK